MAKSHGATCSLPELDSSRQPGAEDPATIQREGRKQVDGKQSQVDPEKTLAQICNRNERPGPDFTCWLLAQQEEAGNAGQKEIHQRPGESDLAFSPQVPCALCLYVGVYNGDTADGKQHHSLDGEPVAGGHDGMPQFMQADYTQNDGRKRKSPRNCRSPMVGFAHYHEEKQEQKGDVDAQLHIANPSGKNRPVSHGLKFLWARPQS